MSTRLIMIRHGETDWNFKKRYCGSMDVGLSARGRRQAERLRKRLGCETIDRIYSSDLKRAMQTARRIFKGRTIEKMPGLREMDFGIFEGMTHDEILNRYPRLYRKWLEDPSGVVIPSSEKLKNFRKRITGVFKKIIVSNRNKTIAVICHGGTISVYMTCIMRSKDFWKMIPASASVTVVEYKGLNAKVRLLNDTGHLNG